MKPLDPGFGEESQNLWGELTTYKLFDETVQKFDSESNKYVGKYPTVRGRWMGVYENLAGAILGKEELAVKPEGVRDLLRIIELARESNEKGATVAWK
jgi:predicted dehydrogenase